MALDQQALDLLSSPDTVDFLVRKNEYFENLIKTYPGVVLTHSLMDRYLLCYANKRDFENMTNILGTSFLNSLSFILGPVGRESLEEAGITQVQQQPYLDLRGSNVLIGFVDTGINYTLDIFRYEDGTSKIQYIYDQTVISPDPPEGFLIGKEYTNEEINLALNSENPYDIVPQTDTSGHGTFLASIAAGREDLANDFIGAAPDAEIIAVKLRKASQYYLDLYFVPENQENAFSSTSVMLGVEYILLKARQLNRPVVICIGLGTNARGHDGLTMLEEYLTISSNVRGVCICTAAGNESQARHHTQGKILSKGSTQSVDIKVGENAGSFYVSIWNGVSDRMSVSIRSPTGELVGRIPSKSGAATTAKLVLERSTVTVVYYFPVEGSGSQFTLIKITDATPGIWTINIYGDIILDGTYHAWLPMTGFVHESIEFLAAVPNYTITTPGTMMDSICCGAYNTVQNSPYSRSSWGPTRFPMLAPDLLAPGVNVSGYYSFGFGTMDGTSVATAITAGACALLMEWGIIRGNDTALSTYQIRAYLIRGCDRSDEINYPNNQWGYGVLNLIRTFQLMR